MFRPRIIPCLLLKGLGLVKTVKFKKPKYIGDPINAVHIFNAKEPDELIFLDTMATRVRRDPDFDLLRKIADESFMPFSVGGGVRSIKTIRKLLNIGAEKVIINTYAHENPIFIREAAETFGSSTIIVAIDAKKKLIGNGYEVMKTCGTKSVNLSPKEVATNMAKMMAGEIMINSLDRDGTMMGYDIRLIKEVADEVDIPVIACGGGGSMDHFAEAIMEGNASAVAAGSYFVYHGPRRAILINFPTRVEQKKFHAFLQQYKK